MRAERFPGRRIAAVAATLAIGTALAATLFESREHIARSYALRADAMLGIGALTVAILGLRGLQNQVCFRRLGVRAPFRDWFGLVTLASFSNYLPLSAGLVAKAYFLKRVHALPYRTFAVGQLALALLIVAANGGVGLAALLPRLAEGSAAPVGAAFALMLASGALLLVPERLARWRGRETGGDAGAVRDLRRSWRAVAICQLGVALMTAECLRLAFSMGSAPVPFAACVVFGAASVLTSLVSITPGAIGIREFLIGALAHLTGFDAREAVIASTLSRAVEMIAIFGLGGAFAWRLSGQVAAGYAGSAPEPPRPPGD